MNEVTRAAHVNPFNGPEHIQFSEALRESERRYSKLIEGLPAAIYTCDSRGRVMLYNKAAASLWGREPEIGKDLWCGSWRIYRTDGSTLPLNECPMAIALLEKRAVFGEEIIIERPDGERRHVLPHPQPIFDAEGNLIEAVNMLVDITDRKHTEYALKESEERFRTMAEQAPDIICMSDAEGKTFYLNTRWAEFTGYRAEAGLGNGWQNLIHPNDKELALKGLQEALYNRANYNCTFRYRNKLNEYAYIKASFSPRFSATNEFMGFIGMLNDITQQENTKSILENIVEDRTRDLVMANAELKRSNLELEQFAYAASHDLQEPLRKIQTFSSLLQKNNRENLDESSIDFLNNITNSAKRLSVLIENLLNYSRISSGEDEFEKVSLKEILNTVKNDLELFIVNKNAVIRDELLPEIEALPFQINQLFQNLLSNSLKFSYPGKVPEIKISCRRLSGEEVFAQDDLQQNVPHYLITFSDNGIGFEQEYADQIFLLFQRLHGQSFYPGSGIGLALCRKIVLNHHGRIYAKSKKEMGTCFYIILPETQPAKPVRL
jgi:PAS domain S-box-containing protein